MSFSHKIIMPHYINWICLNNLLPFKTNEPPAVLV